MNQQQKEQYEFLYAEISKNAGKYGKSVKAQVAVWEDEIPEIQPLLLRCNAPAEYAGKLPGYIQKETHGDKVKMLLSGMSQMIQTALSCMQSVPSIRANMGCGIYPTLFPGVKQALFDDGKMPWVVNHLSYDEISGMKEKDIQITDEFKIGLEHMEYISEHISGSGAYLFPLDLQDPFAVAHMIYGDELFYTMYDDPEFVHHLLDLCCHAINIGMTECLKIMPDSSDIITHYNDVAIPRSRGGLKISVDTATLLGSEHIEEFVVPYMNRVLESFGGGYAHYCGRSDCLFDILLKQEKVYGLNFGQPDIHDMNDILKRLSKAGKIYYGGVPMSEGEDYAAYFSRLKDVATTDGKCRLLLELYSGYDNQDSVKTAWESVFAT